MEGTHKLRLISNLTISLFLFLFLFFVSNYGVVVPVVSAQTMGELQTYIVHVHRSPDTASLSADEDLKEWYMSFLPTDRVTASSSETERPRLVHAYKSAVTGFAARLTEQELLKVKKKPGFVYAYPDRLVPLLTTHSPDFLGLRRNVAGFWNDSNFGRGVIIGVLDSGLSPSHPSFKDDGMPPPPSKWKGACEFNRSDCNNKLIGARNLVRELSTVQGPYDYEGHGTHTAGTAAGIIVENANVHSMANGTASGMAPYAHLAIYKVCGTKRCADSDVLAGIDAAVEDGVDVLSLSLGGKSVPFYSDSTAIGALAAVEKGIFVSCAGGNDGPALGTLSNEAPWILTVGASTMDRSIRSTVQLGNGDKFNGETIYQPSDFPSTQLPLVYAGQIGGSQASACVNGSLDGLDLRGMMVLCDDGKITRVKKGMVVKNAGGAAMIIESAQRAGYTTRDDVHVLPASHVSYADGNAIKTYISSASAPTASISFMGTIIGTSPAPMVGGFSSRGPNTADPSILKPDIIGPGVNILAAWPLQIGSSAFNIISGTSMSTPHLSGLAALLKSSHPEWSPAAIKSAMMTTADLFSNNGSPVPDETLEQANFFAIGSGHVNISQANNPGLIYDINPGDYIGYLCGLRYTDNQVSAIARRAIKCSDVAVTELNYPSFMVFLSSANRYTAVAARTVTNVGAPGSTYTARVVAPAGALVTVKPETLVFSKANEKAQFSVTFTGAASTTGTAVAYSQGHLTWYSADNNTMVNSPIMVAVG